MLKSESSGSCPVVSAGFGEYGGQMLFHGPLAKCQGLGDVAVTFARGNQAPNLDLSCGQASQVLLRDTVHAIHLRRCWLLDWQPLVGSKYEAISKGCVVNGCGK